MDDKTKSSTKIAIIGLGYVGLPLAVEFGKKHDTVGFDINKKRIEDLKNGIDRTLETSSEDIRSAKRLLVTTDIEDIRPCAVFIVTVPTPIDRYNRPDLTYLQYIIEYCGDRFKQCRYHKARLGDQVNQSAMEGHEAHAQRAGPS
jgi:UDP-N-acetyl-D-galactosamine dehydrogenase